MTTAIAIFNFIFSCLKAIPIVDGWFQQFIVFYINQQTQKTKADIADAAALGARATTDEERYESAKMWLAALSRPRISQ